MKVQLVFSDWQRQGYSIYHTEEGAEWSMGDFHHGSTFEGRIELDTDQQDELRQAMLNGVYPVFQVVMP